MPMTAYRRLWAFSLLVLSLALARGLAVPQGVAEARPTLPTPRKFVEENFNPESHYRKLMEIYRKAMEKSRLS